MDIGKGFLQPMNAASSSETAKPLQQFVNSHPWLFILALLVTVEIILFPITLLIRIFFLSLRVPVQPLDYLIELSLVIVAFVFLSQLNWWRQTGFMKGIGRRDVLVCLFPTLLKLFVAFSSFLLLISGSVKISLVLSLAIYSCLIGVAEESLFRGLILQTLLPKGVLRAIFLSALLFALIHVGNLFTGLSMGYVLGQVLDAFGAGIAFAVMRVRTGSIWPAIILHSLTDFGAFVTISMFGIGHPELLFALLAGSIYCSLYLIYAAIALRPSKLRELRTRYQTVPHVFTLRLKGFFLNVGPTNRKHTHHS